MAKLSSSLSKRIAARGFTTKSEEEARKEILAFLVKNGLEDMESEETDTLVDVIESMIDAESDDSPQTEEEEADELADEVEEEEEAPKKKPASKKAPKKVVEEIEEEEDEEEEEEAPAPKKKAAPAPKKKAPKVVEEDEEDEEEEEEAPKKKATAKKETTKKETTKKDVKKASNKRGKKLDPKNNEEDREAFAPLHKLFPEKDYLYAWVASAGVTIKHKGANSQRSMVLIENCSELENGDIRCNLYLLTFTKKTDILDEAGIEYAPCWNGAPMVKGITLKEAVEIIKGLIDEITADVKKIDKKLGDNRKKMEAELEKKAKPATKKASKKVEEAEEEEEEEYEDDDTFCLDKMSRAELKTFIKDNDLDIKVLKSMTEDDIREAIVEAMEDEEEEEEEAPAPKKKAASKKK